MVSKRRLRAELDRSRGQYGRLMVLHISDNQLIEELTQWLHLFQRSLGDMRYTCNVCGALPAEEHRKGCEFAEFFDSRSYE